MLRISTVLFAAFTFSSCNTDKDDNIDIPSTYTFTRDANSTVSFSGQTERLNMLALMSTYLKTSNTVGATALDAVLLNDMFANENDPFSGQAFAKNLKSKCFASDTLIFQQLFESVATASIATGTASDGTAGVLITGSSDPTVGYRVNANGVEPTQVILKGLMGSVFFYQAMEVYLTEDRMGQVGNSDLVDGKNYTDMEHYFDEAFGYFGIPTDFPSVISVDDARFWGKYCNKRNDGLYPNINAEMSEAFRTARAAISCKDYALRDQAIQTIMDKWAIIIAASAVNYLNEGLSTSGTAEYKRHHVLSEAIGFMLALKYHFNGGNAKYPPHYAYGNVESGLNTLNSTTNLYTISDVDIQHVIDEVRGAFPDGVIK